MFLRLVFVVVIAAAFFAIGAWSGGRYPPIREALVAGTETAAEKATQAWIWLSEGPAGQEATRLWHCARDGAPMPVATLPPEDEPDTSLATARAAFERGDLLGAIADYRDLLSEDPENSDILGELGNVYFASGRTIEAAEAYHAAALAMIEEDALGGARALLPAIRSLSPPLALDLEARLAAAAGAVGQ